ncbi:MAG: flagellar hook basal-body protein, partial [bacterium]|nr:flagellar hook basal-body protein [bacterium]
MERALFAAATGMAAQQQNLDTIADNLANADVAGFKGSAQRFAVLAAPGEPAAGTIALGARPIFTQGKLARSDGPFDIAIEGNGFFVLARGRERAYTRDGAFARAADGTLRNAEGWQLQGVRIPADALSATVADDGRVRITTAQGTREIVRLRLAVFPAPERLQSDGGTIFHATPESGHPVLQLPGSGEHAPRVRFGMLERSNVTIIDAMMQLLTAQ